MNNQDLNRFKSIVAALGDYYDKSINSTLVGMYWQDFKEYSIEQFEKAVSDHRKDPDQGMFFPKTAHLIRQIEGTSKDKQNAREAKAERIWSDFMNHLRVRGHRVPFDVQDGAALAAFKTMGGMSQLNLIETKNIEWEGKKFAKLYLDNLEGDKALEGGSLSLTSPRDQKRLESPENWPNDGLTNEERQKNIKEIAKILGRYPKPETKVTGSIEEKKAAALAKAREYMKQKGADNEQI